MEGMIEDRVYPEDTDAGGIAYHGSYFLWAEHGRKELLDSVKKAERIFINFMKPLRFGDSVRVYTEITKEEGDTVEFFQSIRNGDGEVAAELTVRAKRDLS